jgi:hypothetical protein
VFDSAFNVTELEGGLPGVRWGRIDYLNVTAITTKWAIWQYVQFDDFPLAWMAYAASC